jgi:hypothetical protein
MNLNHLNPKLVYTIFEFSPYLKENTLHHYKDHLVNAV